MSSFLAEFLTFFSANADLEAGLEVGLEDRLEDRLKDRLEAGDDLTFSGASTLVSLISVLAGISVLLSESWDSEELELFLLKVSGTTLFSISDSFLPKPS